MDANLVMQGTANVIDQGCDLFTTNVHGAQARSNGGCISAVEMLGFYNAHSGARLFKMVRLVGDMVQTGAALGEGYLENAVIGRFGGGEHVLQTDADEFVTFALVVEMGVGEDGGG